MTTLNTYANNIISFINNILVPLVFAVALIVFLFGVFRYFIQGGGNEEKRSEGRIFIMYAIIGFAVMTSVWGLVNLVNNTFGFNTSSRPCLPTFSGTSNCNNSTTNTGTTNTTTVTPPPQNILPPGYNTSNTSNTNTSNSPASSNNPALVGSPDPNTPQYVQYGPPPLNQ